MVDFTGKHTLMTRSVEKSNKQNPHIAPLPYMKHRVRSFRCPRPAWRDYGWSNSMYWFKLNVLSPNAAAQIKLEEVSSNQGFHRMSKLDLFLFRNRYIALHRRLRTNGIRRENLHNSWNAGLWQTHNPSKLRSENVCFQEVYACSEQETENGSKCKWLMCTEQDGEQGLPF